MKKISIAGAGTMGMGIAQWAAQMGHPVILFDTSDSALQRAENTIQNNLKKLAEKGKISENPSEISNRIFYSNDLTHIAGSDLFIEAIAENFDAKKQLFQQVEQLTQDTILCTNTSSLSINKLSSTLKRPEKFAGLHFFNPATLMKLVEIIPGFNTHPTITEKLISLMKSWDKVPALAKDTPGFIVNRVARPYYGEALKIAEEQLATPQQIDQVMKQLGGFRMGPFELMDFIGLDVNFTVSYSVFEQMYFDPRYRPSILQQRMMESGRLGRKTGIGFYDYRSQNPPTEIHPLTEKTANTIFQRILSMLINEAVDAVYLGIANPQAVDNAMMYGANYPKGLLQWGKEIGFDKVKALIDELFDHYKDPRYRASAGFYHIHTLIP
ncbi:3-hydroxyacyl-CoA dehydrogenase NAD-binding domain-containing protein [Schleiferia thermophila]|jgi:3-hydroxybutyryl-CoA dehydrogenase|uniref:3-hydroxybutyryl-CoA dehydrogenase n=1 Tax=Schleiferia thermophila TaxID=884107 RepID=A0A369A233_9FLAO|nr:3-hydroxyacyl-CoA dehydrogenase NAD-binding domain-containing protein [Schleiferia thermophila]PMB17855.1 3-hydroxybutyryl-CoA dehydrogenase [Fischerella thermalis CCMEE 5319]RCX03245.1 3-hydroxybutyryl-CoA dehydrogenase [Schleiferia thermophila]GCD80373.1 hypothetical protein JCM30197_16200 [Schleiferia thermophila]